MKVLKQLTGFSLALIISNLALADTNLPVIIDTDLAIDDMQAITYLLNQPQLNILAIGIERHGEAKCNAAFRHMGGILHFMHRDNIPFSCGAISTAVTNRFPLTWSDQADSILDEKFSQSYKASYPNDASDLIISALTNATSKVNIIALGPYTSLAIAYLKAPDLFREKINRIYATGSFFHQQKISMIGKNLHASWNFFINPDAANSLLNSQLPLYLNSNNNSGALKVQPIYQQLTQQHQSKAANLVYKILSASKNDWFIADQFTAVWAIHPEVCQPQLMKIQIALTPKDQAGKTTENQYGIPVHVCLKSNEALFDKLFLQGLWQ